MPNLGYKRQFVPMVKDMEKRQTIRAKRRRPIRAGDRLFHWENMRTKKQAKILESDCTGADEIVITSSGRPILNGQYMNKGARERLAYADGFRPLNGNGGAWPRLLIFIKKTHGLPFVGQVIKW